MKKQNLILSMFVCLILGFHLSTHSQTLNDDESDIIICPVNAAFTRYPSVNSINTTQSSFSPSATIACGNFRVYYEDLQLQTGEGFDDPALGAFRRNTLCAVLNYVQSVLHVSVTVDLHVEQSLTPIANPANTSNYRWLALAGPNYKAGTYGSVPGYFGGNLYDHITTGLDPDPADYDAHVTFNFHQIWSNTTPSYPAPLSYWDDYMNTTPSCRADLFSVCLHEIGHCLGFISSIGDDGSANHYMTNLSTNPNSFTKLDQNFFWYGDPRNVLTFGGNKLVNGTTTPSLNTFWTSTPNFLANYTSTSSPNSVWMTNSGAPNNYKAYDGYWYMNVGQMSVWNLARGSFLSHLDRADMAVYRGGQHSPGFQPKYVMGPSILPNEQLRSWTIQEIRMFKTLGYNLNPAFASSTSLSTNNTISNSALLLNSPPCRTNTVSLVRFPLTSNADYINALCDPENKPVDFTLINNNIPGLAIVTTTAIDTYTLPNIGDLNGQQVGIYPNSIYGVRGVTTGGNNHNSVVLTNSHTIVYTPPPGFYGRAEFGFNLWDGLEKGGVKVITIEVLPPTTAFTLTPGSELVINGSFEDATEVKTVANPTVAISTRINGHVTQLNYATHESGGHPYLCLTYGGGYYNRGVIKKESYRYCYNLTSTVLPSMNPEGYGSEYTSCQAQPYNAFVSNVLPVNTGTANNECYVAIRGDYQIWGAATPAMVSTLMNPLKTCGYYRMEFDVAQDQAYPIGFLMKCNLLAATNLTNSSAGLSYNTLQSIPLDYTVSTVITNTTYNWQHVAVDFVYCGAPTKTVLIEVPLQNNTSLPPYSFGIDNISIKEKTTPPPPLIVTSTNSSTLFCPGSTAILTGHAINTSCQPHFTWQPMGMVSNTVVVTPPNPNTSYTLFANDGCRTGSAIVNAAPLPSGSFTAPAICVGSVSPYSLQSILPIGTPSPGVFSGLAVVPGPGGNYVSPSPGVQGAPFSAGVNNYTYTYVYPNGCSKSYTFDIQFLATPTIMATPPCIFPGQSSTLSIQPSIGSYTWYPGGQTTSSIIVSPTVTTGYDFNFNNGGCSGLGVRFTLNVLTPVTFTNLPSSPLCTNQTLTPLSGYLAPGVPTTGTWTASGGIAIVTNSNGSSAVLSSTLTTGIYTLGYSYSPPFSTCNSASQFTISLSPGFSMTPSGPSLHCANLTFSSVVTVTSSTGGLAFNWLPGNLSGSTHSIHPLSSTIYTITGSNGVCSLTVTLPVNTTTQCCVAPNYLTSSTISSGTIGGIGVSTAINQNITITGPVYFSGEFLIAPNVIITVANGGTLTSAVRSIHLYSCHDMWSGIVVNNGGRVNFSTGLDLIEDAVTAISSNGSTNTSPINSNFNIECNSVLFNRNLVGISIQNYTQTANFNAPYLINGCVFTSRDLSPATSSALWPNAIGITVTTTPTHPMGSPYSLNNFTPANLKSPNTTQQPYGVLVYNSGITTNVTGVTPTFYSIPIGLPTGNINLFDNLFYGINSVNSNVISYRNVFQNTRYVNTNPINQGAGIAAINNEGNLLNYNNSLDIVSPVNSATNNNVFYDCHIGIKTYNIYNLNIQYAKFQSTQSVLNGASMVNQGYFGMNCVSNRFKKYFIKNNQFLNVRNGIYFGAIYHQLHIPGIPANGLYWGDVSIQNNIFRPTLTPTTTIVNEFMDNGVVAENLISGIVPLIIANNTPLKIQNNTLSKVYRGVKLSGFYTISAGVNTSSNTIEIKQDPITSNSQWGIKSEWNYNASIRYNTLKGFATTTVNPNAGIYCTMNFNATVQCNTENTLARGYQFASANFNSFWRNNTMQTSGQGLILSNSGFIGPQGNSLTPIDNRWLGTTWTLPSNRSTYVDVSSIAYNSVYSNPLTNPNNSVIWVRNTVSGGYKPQSNGGPPSQSYTLTNAIKLASNSASFFDCPSGTWVGQSGTGNPPSSQRLVNEAVTKDSLGYVDAATLEIHKTNLFRMIDVDTTLKDSSLILSNFYQASKAGNKGKLLQVEKLLATFYDQTLGNNLLSTIVPTTLIETNYRDFYNLVISFKNNGILSTSENASLHGLASKCPFTDGAVVYQARVLYNMANTDVINFEDNCSESGSGGRLIYRHEGNNAEKQELENLEMNYSLYPNPAIDELHIFSKNQTEYISIIITDVNNRLLLSKKTSIEDYHAEIKLNLLNGVYFVTIVNQNNIHFVKKLIISK